MTSPNVFGPSTVKSSPLADWTTLRVGGPAERMVFPESADEVRDTLADAARDGLPWRVLGRGSNLLVSDAGVPGVVLHTRALRGFDDLGPLDPTAAPGSADAAVRVRAGAGLPTSVLLSETRRRGLGGLEALVGYPATVGGAARMNAGGRWGETGARVVSVDVVLPDGGLETWDAARCRFAYRSSALDGVVVVAVEFALPSVDRSEYGRRIEEIHAEKSRAQPLDQSSAGCIFKNPAPGVSAGQLVDQCGLLGARRGGAMVSTKHGNFVVNAGNATCRDVLGLIEDVREEVARRKGVRLEIEVEIWGPGHVPALV